MDYKSLKTTAQKKKFWKENPLNGDISIEIDGFNEFKMKCLNDDSVVKELYWTKFNGWEKTSLTLWKNLLEKIESDSVILDVGAYSGIYSLIASSYENVKHIYAFDIQDNCINRLEENLQLNNISNASIVKAACSNSEDIIEFYYYEEEGIMSSVAGIVPKKMNNLKTSVNSIVLDSWSISESLKNIRLIKMDVEGAEQKTLLGMRDILRKDKPDILIEINDFKDVKKVKNIFPTGYKLYDINEKSLEIKKLGLFSKPSKDRNYFFSTKSKKELALIFEGTVS
ncbi:FkbM family methyltransferase [Nonlabens ulvanivorans]